MVQESKEELSTFLQSGKINERALSESLDFSGLDIDDFDRLKQIHFVLSKPVLDFVRELPNRVRRIKKESRRAKTVTHGRVEGKIDWSETTKLRNSDNYGDNTVFACETPSYEYDIPENLVLKKVLGIIYDVVTKELESVDYSWRTQGWKEDRIRDIRDVFDKNVHVNRITDYGEIDLRPRDLDAARKSRNPLYYRSYELYEKYERLMSNNLEDDIERLLRETLVEPKEVSTLFELFAVFKIIKGLSEKNPLSLQVIEPGSDEIARMESGNRTVKVFHDEQGSLDFFVSVDDIGEVENEHFKRHKQVLENHKSLYKEFTGGETSQSLSQGFPDIIIEVYENGTDEELDKVLLGEVKYTDKLPTFSKGLKQLIEYMKYARLEDSDTYLDESGCKISGLVVTDGLEISGYEENIRCINTGNLIEGLSQNVLETSC